MVEAVGSPGSRFDDDAGGRWRDRLEYAWNAGSWPFAELLQMSGPTWAPNSP